MRKSSVVVSAVMVLLIATTIGCGGDDHPGNPPTGRIIIDPHPDGINAPWYLSGPGEFRQFGAGDTTLDNMPSGDYTIDWGMVFDWDEPGSETQALVTDATVIFDDPYLDMFPDTPQRLMERFKAAYDYMNIDEYRHALHADFIFVFADGSPVAPASGIFTRGEDLQSTPNMLNGELGQDPDGHPLAGVRDVEFGEMTRLTAWEDVPESDVYFPGAIRALFDVRVVFYLNTEDVNSITVDSQQLFYLQSIDEELDGGSSRTRFYMIGQQDLDYLDKAIMGPAGLTPAFVSNENIGWSEIKALYYE